MKNEIFNRRVFRQFVKFAIVGISSTIIDWGFFYLLAQFLGIYYLISKIISFIIAVINSYYWNRRWTFRSESADRTKEFSKFLIVAIIGLSLNTFVMYLAVSLNNLRYIFGLILATLVATFWNFFANKFWTFKKF